MTKPIADLIADLDSGATTSEALTEACLARIEDPAGEGGKAFITVHRDKALATARAIDAQRQAGIPVGPLGGIPISVKDLLDEKGFVTTAGSVVRKDQPAAREDAPVVARLRAAGAVIVGRTNMTEFAFSGIGYNPHYGTPRNPYDRATGRIPGGSSSGAAVSVTDGMAAAAIGSDTGGSIRLPAAFCGITGLKPTQRRVPIEGAFPLSHTLDSLGPLTHRVDCADRIDQVISGEDREPRPLSVNRLRLGVPRGGYVLDDLDPEVSVAFEAALSRLSAAGAEIVEFDFETLKQIPQLGNKISLAAVECFATLRDLVDTRPGEFDQLVLSRIEAGRWGNAADYIETLRLRNACVAQSRRETRIFDSVVMPGNALIAPPIAEVAHDAERFTDRNFLALRNTIVGNFLDRCGITIPSTAPGEAPVGFLLMGETGGDAHLIDVARAIEPVIRVDG
ncbi:MAG: amidase [Alphaproteobacteria bacterium]|nr:amidase [Alphaproteobacteria bacterium]